MKLKIPLIIISLIVIIILIFTFTSNVNGSDFVDVGTSSDNNDNWINNLNVTRNNKFTTLSSNSNSSSWHMANYTFYDDFVIEWDNHGSSNNLDYCIISDMNKNYETIMNFKNLNITNNCHVKLVIMNNTVTPYINNKTNEAIPLKVNPDKGMMFRFQINPNGTEINYSNFKIHSI